QDPPVPCDPLGQNWRGPQGVPGPAGKDGSDAVLEGGPWLPLAGGTMDMAAGGDSTVSNFGDSDFAIQRDDNHLLLHSTTYSLFDAGVEIDGPLSVYAETDNIELFANNIFFDADHCMRFWKDGTAWKLYDGCDDASLDLVYDGGNPAYGVNVYTGDTFDNSSPIAIYTGGVKH